MTLFATSQDVIRYCGLDQSVPARTIDTMIAHVQEEQIRPILGDEKMAELHLQVSTATLTQENKALLTDSVFPFLAWASVHMSVVPMHMKLKDKGVRVNGDGTSSPASMQEFYAYKAFAGERMDAARRRLRDRCSQAQGGQGLYSFLSLI